MPSRSAWSRTAAALTLSGTTTSPSLGSSVISLARRKPSASKARTAFSTRSSVDPPITTRVTRSLYQRLEVDCAVTFNQTKAHGRGKQSVRALPDQALKAIRRITEYRRPARRAGSVHNLYGWGHYPFGCLNLLVYLYKPDSATGAFRNFRSDLASYSRG